MEDESIALNTRSKRMKEEVKEIIKEDVREIKAEDDVDQVILKFLSPHSRLEKVKDSEGNDALCIIGV